MRAKRFERSQREHIIAWGARFLLPLALMPVLAVWYFSSLPESARSLVLGGAVAMTFFFLFGVVMSFLIAMYALFGMLRRARDVNFETALLMAAIAFIATGSMEFVREGMRKPYVLHGVMYSNGIMVKDVPMLNRDGVLAHSRWVQPDTARFPGELAVGEAMYRVQCLRCHEIEGYNAIRPLIRDWNHPLIMSALDHLDKIKPFMPPFVGTQAEKEALAKYLMSLTGTGWTVDSLADSTAFLPATADSLPTEEGSAP
jgi:mono/diheme cytochrome c family protein